MKINLSDRRLWIARGIIVCLVVAIVVGLWLLWEDGFFKGGGWLWPVLGGMFLLGLLPLLGLLAKHRHRGILVLWCRRFSEPNLAVGNRNRWIWAVITEACRGIAIPVTVRDRSLAGSQSVGRSLQNPLSVLLILVGTPLWLWGMLRVLDFVVGSWPEFAVCVAGLAVYIGMFRLIGFLVGMVTKTMATIDGDPEAISRRLKQIKKRGSNNRELDAIRCTDENWQACVSAVLNEVDFVIIDNVDSTDSIDWEIQQSIQRVGVDRVLMLLRQNADPPPEISPILFDFDEADHEIQKLQTKWGDDDFGESVEIGEAGQKLAEALREKLAERMVV